MLDNTNDNAIRKIKAVYDTCMNKLKNLSLAERTIMKEYRETDRQKKIKEIKDQLDI